MQEEKVADEEVARINAAVDSQKTKNDDSQNRQKLPKQTKILLVKNLVWGRISFHQLPAVLKNDVAICKTALQYERARLEELPEAMQQVPALRETASQVLREKRSALAFLSRV